jgi:hypothetical protein
MASDGNDEGRSGALCGGVGVEDRDLRSGGTISGDQRICAARLAEYSGLLTAGDGPRHLHGAEQAPNGPIQ